MGNGENFGWYFEWNEKKLEGFEQEIDVTYYFYLFLFGWAHAMWVTSSSTRDQPMSPAVQVWSPNLWTARDITISTLPPETVDMKWVKNGKYSCVCLGPFVHTLPRQSTCHIVFQWPAYQLPLTYAISLFTLYAQSLEGGVGFRT